MTKNVSAKRAKTVPHPNVADRRAKGADARIAVPPSVHGSWAPAADRFDPVQLLCDQDTRREQDLVPVRHGRMMVSPFTFYRGAARVMAADLADTPTAGLIAQLCGDAHLSNFGGFASPERKLVFDTNDFDETLPGPFEWDVKRMAASFTIAAQNNGLTPSEARAVTLAAVRSYREAMMSFADMGTMELWYARMSEDDLTDSLGKLAAELKGQKAKKLAGKHGGKRSKSAVMKAAAGKNKAGKQAELQALKVTRKTLAKAHTRDSLQALSKLAHLVDGKYRIVNQPPIVVPIRDWIATQGVAESDVEAGIRQLFREYRATLPDDRRRLLERFEVVDVARKVVGVGSVGTRCFIVLLQGRDAQDPLFLQVKEATASVLEDHLPKSRYANPGERVVQGQRMMQAASDIYLGWSKGLQLDRFFYWRQLRDMKESADIDNMSAFALGFYARLCGWTLARGHARSGDAIAMAEYLGADDTFERAIADFSASYAVQNQQDYDAYVEAVDSGRITAIHGV